MSFFSWNKKHSKAPSTSTPASGPQSQSQSQSPQEKQQSQPVYPWSAHAPPFGQSLSPFLQHSHALSTSATAAGELFLFGGYVPRSRSANNDLYVISTRDFSTTLLQTSGDVPSPRYGHCATFTSSILLIWGGMTNFSDQIMRNQAHDDSLYLLNLGTSGLLLSRPAPADQNFFYSSIARVDLRLGRWCRPCRSLRSLLPYHDVGRFQALRLRRLVRYKVSK
jgi:Galactose oxidase, central domain